MKYIFIYVCSVLLLLTPSLTAQTPKSQMENTPVYKGTYIGVNVLPIVSSLFSSEIVAYEFSLDVNLSQKYYPIIELGFENRDYNTTDYTYTSDGIYGKFGVNYNFLKPSKIVPNNIFYIGARYALASTTYELNTILSNTDWNEEGEVFLLPTNKLASWGEVVLGARAELFPSVLFGASVRYAFNSKNITSSVAYPTYMPGFGLVQPNKWLFSYSIIYKLPF
jgi:hypothetical protein